LETVLAAAHSSWKLLGLELKIMVTKAHLLELSISWEITRPHAGVARGLSTCGNTEIEAD